MVQPWQPRRRGREEGETGGKTATQGGGESAPARAGDGEAAPPLLFPFLSPQRRLFPRPRPLRFPSAFSSTCPPHHTSQLQLLRHLLVPELLSLLLLLSLPCTALCMRLLLPIAEPTSPVLLAAVALLASPLLVVILSALFFILAPVFRTMSQPRSTSHPLEMAVHTQADSGATETEGRGKGGAGGGAPPAGAGEEKDREKELREAKEEPRGGAGTGGAAAFSSPSEYEVDARTLPPTLHRLHPSSRPCCADLPLPCLSAAVSPLRLQPRFIGVVPGVDDEGELSSRALEEVDTGQRLLSRLSLLLIHRPLAPLSPTLHRCDPHRSLSGLLQVP